MYVYQCLIKWFHNRMATVQYLSSEDENLRTWKLNSDVPVVLEKRKQYNKIQDEDLKYIDVIF